MLKLNVCLNEEQKDVLFRLSKDWNLSLAGVMRKALEEMRPSDLEFRTTTNNPLTTASETEIKTGDHIS